MDKNRLKIKLNEQNIVSQLCYPLNRLSTFCVGGEAEIAIFPKNTAELRAAIRACKEEGAPIKIIGNGSKLLFSDKGYCGAIIKPLFSNIEFYANTVFVGAGVPLIRLAVECEKRGLSGLERLSLIPARVGGAIIKNASAYGESISEKIVRIETYDEKSDRIKSVALSECCFGYHESKICGAVTGAVLCLAEGEESWQIENRRRAYERSRLCSQPYCKKTCGSVFKNGLGYYAASLIEQSGLKGMTVGGASVSYLHANFIENDGTATQKDISNLIYTVKEKVYNDYCIELQEEIETFP